MDSKELWHQYNLSYDDQLNFLKNKYGLPQGNYFLTESCKSTNNKIKRAKEGLYVHHDYEWNPNDWTCHSLSTQELALKYPFEYQLSDHLTYCNMLEHLMLHMKIYRLRRDYLGGPIFTDGVQNFLIPQINDIYQTRKYKQEWLIATKEAIVENYNDYIELIKIHAEDSDQDVVDLYGLSLR